MKIRKGSVVMVDDGYCIYLVNVLTIGTGKDRKYFEGCILDYNLCVGTAIIDEEGGYTFYKSDIVQVVEY